MFKNVMLGVMSFLLVGWILIYSAGSAEADRNKRNDFEYVGKAGDCDVYTGFSNGHRLYVVSAWRTSSVSCAISSN